MENPCNTTTLKLVQLLWFVYAFVLHGHKALGILLRKSMLMCGEGLYQCGPLLLGAKRPTSMKTNLEHRTRNARGQPITKLFPSPDLLGIEWFLVSYSACLRGTLVIPQAKGGIHRKELER